MEQTTELVRSNGQNSGMVPAATSGQISNSLVPRSLEECAWLAERFFRAGMYALNSPEQALVVLLTGMDLGVTPSVAFRSIHVIKNKPSPSADLMAAACLSKPHICEYLTLTESDAFHATMVTRRVGAKSEVIMTYTIDEAKVAGLMNNDNWRKDPVAMCIARVKARITRAVYPDLVLGLYTPDEVANSVDYDEPVTQAARTPTITTPVDHVSHRGAPPPAISVTDPKPATKPETVSEGRDMALHNEFKKALTQMTQPLRVEWFKVFEADYGTRDLKIITDDAKKDALRRMDQAKQQDIAPEKTFAFEQKASSSDFEQPDDTVVETTCGGQADSEKAKVETPLTPDDWVDPFDSVERQEQQRQTGQAIADSQPTPMSVCGACGVKMTEGDRNMSLRRQTGPLCFRCHNANTKKANQSAEETAAMAI